MFWKQCIVKRERALCWQAVMSCTIKKNMDTTNTNTLTCLPIFGNYEKISVHYTVHCSQPVYCVVCVWLKCRFFHKQFLKLLKIIFSSFTKFTRLKKIKGSYSRRHIATYCIGKCVCVCVCVCELWNTWLKTGGKSRVTTTKECQ